MSKFRVGDLVELITESVCYGTNRGTQALIEKIEKSGECDFLYLKYLDDTKGVWGKEVVREDHIKLIENLNVSTETEKETENTEKLPESGNSALKEQRGGSHYKDMKIQPIEYVVGNNLSFLQGNVIKYVSRYKNKNGKEDIKKAIHCLELILELEYKEEKGV
jgi:hypothetical protein